MRKENNRVTGLGASVILGMWESERALHSKQRLNNIKNMRSLFSDATLECICQGGWWDWEMGGGMENGNTGGWQSTLVVGLLLK